MQQVVDCLLDCCRRLPPLDSLPLDVPYLGRFSFEFLLRILIGLISKRTQAQLVGHPDLSEELGGLRSPEVVCADRAASQPLRVLVTLSCGCGVLEVKAMLCHVSRQEPRRSPFHLFSTLKLELHRGNCLVLHLRRVHGCYRPRWILSESRLCFHLVLIQLVFERMFWMMLLLLML